VTVPALSDEPSPRPLTGGAVIAAASRVGITAAGAVTTIVLARVLGPRGWGTYVITGSFVAILVSASTLGVEHGIAYFVGSSRWGARAAFASALKIAGCMGVVGAAVGVGVRLIVPSAFAGLPVWLTIVVAAGLPFALASIYTSFIALATDRYEAAMAIPGVQTFLVLCLAVPGAAVDGVTGAIMGGWVATALTAAGAVAWGKQRLARADAPSSTHLRAAVTFGIKGYAANALQMINYRLDLFFLAAAATPAKVGQYGLAVAVTSLLWVLPNALSDVLFPRIARLSGNEETTTREMVESKSLRHATLIVIVTALALVAVLELLVVPVFGARFQPAINLGLILLPGAAAVGVASVLSAIVVGRGKPSYSLYNSLATAPATILMYATLIPWLGASGAAIASTISYVASLLIVCGFYRHLIGCTIWRSFVPTVAELRDLCVALRPVARVCR
jgi:O-antigen/teichoic acid export membrane protein